MEVFYPARKKKLRLSDRDGILFHHHHNQVIMDVQEQGHHSHQWAQFQGNWFGILEGLMMSLSDDKQADVIGAFNTTSSFWSIF